MSPNQMPAFARVRKLFFNRLSTARRPTERPSGRPYNVGMARETPPRFRACDASIMEAIHESRVPSRLQQVRP